MIDWPSDWHGWQLLLTNPNRDPLTDALWLAAEEFEGGSRQMWALRLWGRFVAILSPPNGDPRQLPACANQLRSAYDSVTESFTPQMRKKALAALRTLMSRCNGLCDVLAVMPRFVAHRRSNPLKNNDVCWLQRHCCCIHCTATGD